MNTASTFLLILYCLYYCVNADVDGANMLLKFAPIVEIAQDTIFISCKIWAGLTNNEHLTTLSESVVV